MTMLGDLVRVCSLTDRERAERLAEELRRAGITWAFVPCDRAIGRWDVEVPADDAGRAAALAELHAADEACRRAQVELSEVDAMIAGAANDRSALASWRARRAELLQTASDQAARVAALYSPNGIPNRGQAYA